MSQVRWRIGSSYTQCCIIWDVGSLSTGWCTCWGKDGNCPGGALYKEVFRCLLQLALIILKWWGCAWVSWWRMMEEDDDAYWLKVRCHRDHCLILLGVVYKHFMNRLHLMHTLLSIQTGICQCMHTACMHLPYQRNDHRHHKQEQTSEIIWSPCHVHEGFGNHWYLRIHSYLWLFVLQFVGLKLAVYNSK